MTVTKQNYWTDIPRSRLNRRRLLASAALSGAPAALLVACAGSSRQASKQATGSSGSSSAGKAPQAGGTLNTYLAVSPDTLDPQRTKANTALAVAGHVSSRLFRHKAGTDPNVALGLELENDLAVSAESPDGLTWTMKLRPGAKFQNTAPVNGRTVTAEDIQQTFKRVMTVPGSTGPSSFLMLDANQIETPAADTVVFKLKYVYASFPQTLTSFVAAWILPKEAITGAYDPAKQIIGSGPFMLDNYTPDVAVSYKKNPDWFDKPKPYATGERAAIIADPGQQLAQFTAGNLDELAVPQNNLDAAKQSNPKATLISAPYPNSYQIYGHMDRSDSAYQDIRVRQAISMAIDRAAIGKAVFNDVYHNNGMLSSAKQKWALPPDQLGDASKSFTYNLAEAKKLVAASGVAGQLHKFVYPKTAYGPQFDTIAQMLNPMLNAAGFKTELVAVDYRTEFINVGKGILYGHYDSDTLVLCIWMIGTSTAEDAFFGSLLPGGTANHMAVDDPTLAAMVKKMVATLDENERLKAVQEIQRYIAEKMYYISSIPTGDVYTLVGPRVQNYTYSLTPAVEGTETYANVWLPA